jgi:hypothetical protein
MERGYRQTPHDLDKWLIVGDKKDTRLLKTEDHTVPISALMGKS